MASNRCPDCNKFVGFVILDEGEAEIIQVEEEDNGKARVTLTLTLTKVCIECGTELQTGQTDIDVEVNLKDIEFEEV